MNIHDCSRSILSIDIGIKNLGYAVFFQDDLQFGMFNIAAHLEKKCDLIIQSCSVIREFIKSFQTRFDLVIVERQVRMNPKAMQLMYSVVSVAQEYADEVITFDPRDKFRVFGIEYSSKNKQHKKLSVNMARDLIHTRYPEKLSEFESFKKKDDIADAINQGYTVMFQRQVVE